MDSTILAAIAGSLVCIAISIPIGLAFAVLIARGRRR